MADRKYEIRFSARWRNEVKVKNMLIRAELATSYVLSQKRLEKLLVRRTKDRFRELGTTKNAQRSPDGQLWPELAQSTNRYHKNANRILFQSGALMRSITDKKSRMKQRQLSSATGGGFRIGVAEDAKSNPQGRRPIEYARAHQFGIQGRMPARRFLGIGKDDVEAVDNLIKRSYKQFGITVR